MEYFPADTNLRTMTGAPGIIVGGAGSGNEKAATENIKPVFHVSECIGLKGNSAQSRVASVEIDQRTLSSLPREASRLKTWSFVENVKSVSVKFRPVLTTADIKAIMLANGLQKVLLNKTGKEGSKVLAEFLGSPDSRLKEDEIAALVVLWGTLPSKYVESGQTDNQFNEHIRLSAANTFRMHLFALRQQKQDEVLGRKPVSLCATGSFRKEYLRFSPITQENTKLLMKSMRRFVQQNLFSPTAIESPKSDGSYPMLQVHKQNVSDIWTVKKLGGLLYDLNLISGFYLKKPCYDFLTDQFVHRYEGVDPFELLSVTLRWYFKNGRGELDDKGLLAGLSYYLDYQDSSLTQKEVSGLKEIATLFTSKKAKKVEEAINNWNQFGDKLKTKYRDAIIDGQIAILMKLIKCSVDKAPLGEGLPHVFLNITRGFVNEFFLFHEAVFQKSKKEKLMDTGNRVKEAFSRPPGVKLPTDDCLKFNI